MTIEERLQQFIGQQVFQIAGLSVQLETALKENEELKKKVADKPSDGKAA